VNLDDEDRAIEELQRAVASGHPETVARAALDNLWPLYSAHFEALSSAIESIPTAQLARYPALRALHPMTRVIARTVRPFKPINLSDEARSMSPSELDLITLVQMMAFRLSGDVTAALIYAKRLEDRLLQVRVEWRERTDGPLWYLHLQIGSTLLVAGDSFHALLSLATARQLGQLSRQPDAQRTALGRTALAHAVRGSLDDAETALAEAGGKREPSAAHLSACSSTETAAAALIAVERMSADAETLTAALEPYDSIELSWSFALLARTRAFLAAQRPADALEAIRLASDAHPAQHGSFALDVITSASISALGATGELRAAWNLAGPNAMRGTLTSLAAIRLALENSRLNLAAAELRRVSGLPDLGPGERAEIVLLTAWLTLARADDISDDTIAQIYRLAMRGNHRRQLATMPRQLLDRVASGLAPEEANFFAAATRGLPGREMHTRPVLTRGELRVLTALPLHQTTAEIATAFHVSPNTIKSQLKALYRKLECSTRDEAIRAAVRHHLISTGGDDTTLRAVDSRVVALDDIQ
jgi:DNA-binding CsgD family transcriptional regulator